MEENNGQGQVRPIGRRDELRLQTMMSDTEKLRDLQFQITGNERQILLVALGSSSVAVRLLLAQATQLPGIILAELLYLLTIVYAAVAMNSASDTYTVGLIGRYIGQQIDPEVDRIAKQNGEVPVPHWETFLSLSRTELLPYILNIRDQSGR